MSAVAPFRERSGNAHGNLSALVQRLRERASDGRFANVADLVRAMPTGDTRLLRGTSWAPLPGRMPVPLGELGDGCKWPVDYPAGPAPGGLGFGFCGAARDQARVYCPHHAAIAYPPAAPPPAKSLARPGRSDRHFVGAGR